MVMLTTLSLILPLWSPDAAEAQVPSCAVGTDDILGWWRGENDLTARIGPNLNGSVGFVDSIIGRGMDFTGNNTVGVDTLPAVTDQVTVEAWVKPVNTGQVQSLVSRWTWVGGDNDDSYALFLGVNSELFWITDETSTRSPVSLSARVPQIYDGQFHHVAATWSPTVIKVYLDGIEVASAPSQGGILNPGSTTQFRLGSSGGPGSPLFYSGILDEATVYRRALTPTEIAGIVSAGPSAKCAWTQRARFDGPGGEFDQFGYDVAVDGNTMVAGSFTTPGRAYVYTRTGTTWTQQAELVPTGDSGFTDFFGSSVAIGGDTIVVGAYQHNAPIGPIDPGTGLPTPVFNTGAAYVFTRTGTTWTQQAKLLPADLAEADLFGWSVAVQGDTALVGSFGDDDGGQNSGSAYAFSRSGSAWTQQGKLTAADPSAEDQFGFRVALDGQTAVVGAHKDDVQKGSAYVFLRTGAAWAQQAELTAADGVAFDQFGYAVDVSGDTIVAGAWFDSDGGSQSGSAYVFVRSAGVWSPQAKIVAPGAGAGDYFGAAVGIDGNTLLIGAPGDDLVALVDRGTVRSFTRVAGAWTFESDFVTGDALAGGYFGGALDINGPTAAVGAQLTSGAASESGRAFIFSR
jgi:hypothetical protein